MEKIRPIRTEENSQSLASLGYPVLLTLITGLTAACNLSRNDTQMLIPNVIAPLSGLLGLVFGGCGYLLLKNINRK